MRTCLAARLLLLGLSCASGLQAIARAPAAAVVAVSRGPGARLRVGPLQVSAALTEEPGTDAAAADAPIPVADPAMPPVVARREAPQVGRGRGRGRGGPRRDAFVLESTATIRGPFYAQRKPRPKPPPRPEGGRGRGAGRGEGGRGRGGRGRGGPQAAGMDVPAAAPRFGGAGADADDSPSSAPGGPSRRFSDAPKKKGHAQKYGEKRNEFGKSVNAGGRPGRKGGK